MKETQIPWYIRLLTFYGASMAGSFLLLFLGLFELLNSTPVVIFLGIVFIVVSTALSFRKDNGFIEPTIISFVNLGQGLFLFGFADIFTFDIVSICVLIFFLQLILYAVFQSSIQKFLSVIIGIISLVVILIDTKLSILFPILLYAVMLALYWTSKTHSQAIEKNEPVSSLLSSAKEALTLSLAGLFVFPLIDEDADLARSISLTTSVLIWITLFVLLWNQLYIKLKWKKEFLFGIFLLTVLIFLPTVYHPGISGSIFILFLGFAYSQRPAQWFGVFSSLGYLTYYYYAMETTLLYKSYQMILSGILFLAIYAIWQFKLSKKEGVTE
ncbi:DUF4401 domain-containing protein [Leptospira idonii]|nr:DUF4401 domain-containing protein [Leptospira idonii]